MVNKRCFLAYLDEDSIKKDGYFDIVEESVNFLKFRTNNGAEITIPYSRLLKMKESGR